MEIEKKRRRYSDHNGDQLTTTALYTQTVTSGMKPSSLSDCYNTNYLLSNGLSSNILSSNVPSNNGLSSSQLNKKKKDEYHNKQQASRSMKQTTLLAPSLSHMNMRCPICDIQLWSDMNMNNLHIDCCLMKPKSSDIVKNSKDSSCNSYSYNYSSSSISDKHVVIMDQMIRPPPTLDYKKAIGHHATNMNDNTIITSYGFNVTVVQELPGLFLLHDFINESEEEALLHYIQDDLCQKCPWKHSSFNGHCMSMTFGVKTQFGLPDELRLVRENNVDSGELDIPDRFHTYITRLQTWIAALQSTSTASSSSIVLKKLPVQLRCFKPNDCNINSYDRNKNHSLKPHFDDRALSGPILLNLSLAGAAIMTYTKPSSNGCTTTTSSSSSTSSGNRSVSINGNSTSSASVLLPRRCLQIVSGAARYSFMHEIVNKDLIDNNRISITWRQSGQITTYHVIIEAVYVIVYVSDK